MVNARGITECTFPRLGGTCDKLIGRAWLVLKTNKQTNKQKQRKRDHNTQLLHVKFSCEYKIAPLAYRHFDGTLPSYLSASLCTYQTSRILRTSNDKLLKIPKRNLKSSGDRSFSVIAPTVWNSLPASLGNFPTLSDFKAQLKKRYFH